MFIKALSDKSTVYAEKIRDLLEATALERVILVPYGVRKIYINESEYSGEFYVSMWRDCEELDVATGFPNYLKSWEYANTIATEAGLCEEAIESVIYSINEKVAKKSFRK
jgi:hypothetical protein